MVETAIEPAERNGKTPDADRRRNFDTALASALECAAIVDAGHDFDPDFDSDSKPGRHRVAHAPTASSPITTTTTTTILFVVRLAIDS